MLPFRNMLLLLLVLAPTTLHACPFCSAVAQTFSEEMQTVDVAVICELKQLGVYQPEDNEDPQGEIPKSVFVVKQVLKGNDFIKLGDTFSCVYFGEEKKERPFLAMATDAPKLQWSTPLLLTDRAKDYLGLLMDLNSYKRQELRALQEATAPLSSKKDASAESRVDDPLQLQLTALKSEISAKRLVFFQDYLEDEDEMLARDAYDEFAEAPYEAVKAIKGEMDHEQLIRFLNNPEVPSNRRRLYFTMLGVCGTQSDADMLERFMLSDDRKQKAGLDALIACYLILTGEKGLETVEARFLKDRDVEYADTYSAIMAIRFHGSEIDVIPRPRLTKALHHMLDRPDLADLVIPDLARWEDWSVIPKLVDLFAKADETSSWVRVPVVNYLRVCPLPVAQEKIEFLRTIDAEAVQRAMSFFQDADEEEEATSNETDKASAAPVEQINEPTASTSNPATQMRLADARAEIAQVDSGRETTPAQEKQASIRVKDSKSKVSINTPDTLQQVESNANAGISFWKLCGITFLGASACLIAMRTALGGHQ